MRILVFALAATVGLSACASGAARVSDDVMGIRAQDLMPLAVSTLETAGYKISSRQRMGAGEVIRGEAEGGSKITVKIGESSRMGSSAASNIVVEASSTEESQRILDLIRQELRG